MGEIAEPLNNRAVNPDKVAWVKWLIWIPWMSIIIWLLVRAGGYSSVNLLHLTESGISVDAPPKYIIYFIVIALFIGLAAIFGCRTGCHTICWMAPFMIIGRWIRNRLAWPSLRLVASAETCSDCKRCVYNCPMSLDVNKMVKREQMEHSECILCGNCADTCARKAIRYSFSAGVGRN